MSIMNIIMNMMISADFYSRCNILCRINFLFRIKNLNRLNDSVVDQKIIETITRKSRGKKSPMKSFTVTSNFHQISPVQKVPDTIFHLSVHPESFEKISSCLVR